MSCLIESLCTMFSCEKEDIPGILDTNEGLKKCIWILEQVELRSRCHPDKDLFPFSFTDLSAHGLVNLNYKRNKRGEYYTFAEYYLEEFGIELKYPHFPCIVSNSFEDDQEPEFFPLEVLYIKR